jgi:hypothetical protein
MRLLTLTLAGVLTLGALADTAGPYGDISGLKILKPEDKEDVKPMPAPRGAVVLFDGKSLAGWQSRDGKSDARWTVLPGGILQVKAGTGDIITREKFAGRFDLHVEFRVPYLPKLQGQARGNSGVYLQGRYEVQVLDSYGLQSKDNDCGAIYEVSAPRVNACKAPTVWQSYDIVFQAPTCENGKKAAPAVITVHHNGIKIQDHVKIPVDNTRAGMGGDPCTPGPILLQDHGHPVQYRNLWLRPLAARGASGRQ